MRFIDQIQITVASGKGGPGAVSFRREACIPRGGPDGGDGGRGGHVIFKVNPQLHSLLDLHYQRKYQAGDGVAGGGSNMTGADGKDMVIQVPKGTVIRSLDNHLIADLNEPSDFLYLDGGRGGKGNSFFKSSVNQAPLHAQPGEAGKFEEVILELKLIADIGLIGFPNVGKSTLISRISSAKPKIADYPFTTLVPNLGVVRFGEELSFVVADIPGLIADAHLGHGLGTTFLRHIERTKAFVHLIDVGGMTGRDPLEDYFVIQNELKKHDEINAEKEDYIPLAERPQILVLNKVDAVLPEDLLEIEKKFKDKEIKVLPISAVTGKNVKELVYMMGREVFVTKNQEV